jgi:hypothetical protein
VGDPSVRGTPAPVRAVLLVAIGVLWLMWCVAFVVSEVWLRRRGRPVEFGVRSPGAWAVALLPALPVGVALLTGDVVWLWLALACVLAPYYGVIQGVRERRSDEKHEAAGEAAASDPN